MPEMDRAKSPVGRSLHDGLWSVVPVEHSMEDPEPHADRPPYRGQFGLLPIRAVRQAAPLLPTWRQVDLPGGDWGLLAHPDVPVLRLEDASGQDLGAVLGRVIPSGDATLQNGGVAWLSDDLAPDALRRLRGSWLAIVRDSEGLRVQPDPIASIPFVYDSERGLAGASPGLLDKLHGASAQLAADAFSENELSSDCWYPFGLCPQVSVRRLLPNHVLELDGMSERRVHRGPPGDLPDREAALDELEAALRAVLHALDGPLSVPLTAGRDSRLILAAALAVGHEPQTLTLALENLGVDQIVAPKLANAAGMPHQLFQLQRRKPTEVRAWFDATGRCVGGRNQEYKRPEDSMPTGVTELSGSGGELMRGFYWRGSQDPPLPAAATLVTQLGLPCKPRFREAAEAWLEGLSELPAHRILDLAYAELRMGCWAGPQLCGRLEPYNQFFAFGQAEVLDAANRLPRTLRVSGHAADALIRRLAPALGRLPFNRGPFGARALGKLAKLKDPRYLIRKVRQKLG